jgi:hypothetical protein
MKQTQRVFIATVAVAAAFASTVASTYAAATLPSVLPNATFAEPITGKGKSGLL